MQIVHTYVTTQLKGFKQMTMWIASYKKNYFNLPTNIFIYLLRWNIDDEVKKWSWKFVIFLRSSDDVEVVIKMTSKFRTAWSSYTCLLFAIQEKRHGLLTRRPNNLKHFTLHLLEHWEYTMSYPNKVAGDNYRFIIPSDMPANTIHLDHDHSTNSEQNGN